ncbi:MAG: VPGUxxT family thioredoxin-like (seleno)protein, type 2, partial [Verrucomicrobiota bacterium]
MKNLLIVLLIFALLPSTQAGNPEEVGDVNWGRNYEHALAQAKESGKPIFLLFQEVPGCAGCKQFGNDVLSDPKVVAAIEDNFIPLLIHNNKGGEDGRIRKQFGEPAWNYQVVRFLDSNGKDIIPRKDRVWTGPEIMARIQTVLTKTKTAASLSQSNATARVAFCQFCFWTGEYKMGALPSVIETEAGFIGGREVTLVTYDPSRISLQALIAKATAEGVNTDVYLDDPSQIPGSKKLVNYRPAPHHDQKKQIQGTVFAQLDLSPEQATKINAYARSNPQKALQYLSPEQREQPGEFHSIELRVLAV